MPALRSPELEALFGGPLDSVGITEEAIDRLISEGAREGEQLDFKAVESTGLPYLSAKGHRPSWSEEQEFAKDIAALANQRGGVLLIGVAEADGIAVGRTPVTRSTAEAEERRLRQALRNYQAPYVEAAFVPVEAASSGWYLAIVVPPSARAPHAVLGDPNDGKRPLRYPVRHGSDTIWLTEHEVADRYRRRISGQEAAVERSRRAVDAGTAVLRRSQGLWIYVAIIPEIPAYGRLDNSVVQDIIGWRDSWRFYSPLGRTLEADGRGIPAPGCVTFSMRRATPQQDEATIWGAYLELHLDGSAFAAMEVLRNDDEAESRTQVGILEIIDDLIVMVALVLGWCSDRVGAWGTATVTSGILDADTDEVVPASPLTLVRSGRFGVERYPGTRQLTILPASSVVTDLAAVESAQDRLAVTYLAASSLLQWFGVAEPAQLRPDGAIVPAHFSDPQDVQRWARQHEVHAQG